MTVTAYAPSAGGVNCDANCEVTASGLPPRIGMAACPRNFDFGTRFYVPGRGIVECQDRGGRITRNHLDILMETEKEALEWGIKKLPVFVLSERE